MQSKSVCAFIAAFFLIAACSAPAALTGNLHDDADDNSSGDSNDSPLSLEYTEMQSIVFDGLNSFTNYTTGGGGK
jgi:hypothetical protein